MSLITTNCACGNQISYNESKHVGGMNDKYDIDYECNNCKKAGSTLALNADFSFTMDGAKVIRKSARD